MNKKMADSSKLTRFPIVQNYSTSNKCLNAAFLNQRTSRSNVTLIELVLQTCNS